MDYTKLLKKLSNTKIDPELLERINKLGKNHKDALTGLLDYRSFSWQMEEKLATSKPFSLTAVSIDFLQELNLISGWVIGDLALCAMASLLENLPTPEGLAGRISGATFMVYFPKTDIALLRSWLADVSAKLAAFEFPGLEMFPENHLTLSAGIYCNLNDPVKVEESISEAKQRLKSAEKQGGGSVVVLSDKQAVLADDHTQHIDVRIKKHDEQQWIKAELTELSLNGLSLVEDVPFLVREQVDVVLSVQNIKISIALEGEVVWRKPFENDEKEALFCLGLKYLKLNQKQLDSLEQLMAATNQMC